MNSEFVTFKKNLGEVLADAVLTLNEVAEACDEPVLKEKVSAVNGTMDRARRLCKADESAEEHPAPGEPAPEFGEGVRLIEL